MFELVKKLNMHPACDGERGCATWCHNDAGECSKRFPKPLCDEASFNEDGFPQYKRRSPEDGGHSFELGNENVEMTNEWVVPYNPYLTMRYQCHINVEIVSTMVAIKYLYKYLCKGLDRGWAKLTEADETKIDEGRMYADSRVIGPYDATYTIF